MTNTERDTYDTARAYQSEEFLFTPRSTGVPSKRHVRKDARVVLVDRFDVAEIPYREFDRIHPEMFAEILRYARGRHALDRPGRLIELTERLIELTDAEARGPFESAPADGSAARE